MVSILPFPNKIVSIEILSCAMAHSLNINTNKIKNGFIYFVLERFDERKSASFFVKRKNKHSRISGQILNRNIHTHYPCYKFSAFNVKRLSLQWDLRFVRMPGGRIQ